uniref:Uncharacterized protein n=1 Tax=Oryza glumipatula TaxID=40148 RepID=A0A0E0AAH4_9ORYZ
MTLGEEAESVRAFRTRCPLHQEVGSCVLELGLIERWALALRVRKAEEVEDRKGDGPVVICGIEKMEEWKWKRIISMSTSKRTLAE